MKTMPNLTIICPSTPNEVRQIIQNLNKIKGPVYIRLGKKGENEFFKNFKKSYNYLKPYKIIDGNNICILNVGHILKVSYDLANLLNANSKKNIAALYNLITVKPINIKFILGIAKKFKKILVIEEHGRQGSIHETIASIITDFKITNVELYGINAPDKVNSNLGSQEQARKSLGFDPKKIIKRFKL